MKFNALCAVLFLFLLSTAQTVSAGTIKASGKSDFGDPGSLTQDTSTSLGGGFTASLDDSASLGTDSYLEIDTPSTELSAGTIIQISGLDTSLVFDSVYCAASSFLGSCDPDGTPPVSLTVPQSNCVGTLSETNPSAGVFDFTAPQCTTTSSYSMVLIFSNGGTLPASDLTGITANTIPPTGAPEPSLTMMLGAGLVGLAVRKYSGCQARS